MEKLWSKTEIAHLKRHVATQRLEELAQRFHTDIETVKRKIKELGLAGSGEPEAVDSAVDRYKEALEALHAKNWTEADRLLALVVAEADTQQMAERARQYRAVCRQHLEKAEPAAVDPYLEAVVLKNEGRYAQALKLVEAGAADERSLYLRASLLALTGSDDEALALLGKAIELEPANRVHAYHDPDFKSLRGREGFQSLLRARR
jgi:tetratricopeptide (TPR) repeat protein